MNAVFLKQAENGGLLLSVNRKISDQVPDERLDLEKLGLTALFIETPQLVLKNPVLEDEK